MTVLRCSECAWRRDYGAGVTPWRDRCAECGGRAFVVDREAVEAMPVDPDQLSLLGESLR